jgi:hypothetical protein
MSAEFYIYMTAIVIVATVLLGMFRKSFDPFAPHWLFLAGYAQVYVVQALSYREWAIRIRGEELVTAATARALWALVWFLAVYYSGLGRRIAGWLPRPPAGWSPPLIASITPVLIGWGLICAGLLMGGDEGGPVSAEGALVRAFPILMLVGAILLIVTGRADGRSRPIFTWAGIAVVSAYIVIWMIRGKRTPPLFGVLATVCALYTSRGTRPSKLVLAGTAMAAIMVVTLAIGFRGNPNYDHDLSGFIQYATEFDPESMLVNLNVKSRHEEAIDLSAELESKETEEWGGYLLMLDTVPSKSDYDYGASYLRLFSTYIPRLIWPSKPIYGREQWVNAWIAGSQFKRDSDFTGPAIGILGATQLNGGATATAIVLAVLALLLRTSYEFFRRYESLPFVQAWWSLTYFNAWLMTVNDDPFVWFYYIYGHTTLPPLAFLWVYHMVKKTPAAGGRAVSLRSDWADHGAHHAYGA